MASTPKPITKNPLRCNCPTHRMLALYGRDENGKAYVHVVAHRGSNKLAQVYTHEPIDLWCKACGQWWHINIRNDDLKLNRRETPSPVAADRPRRQQTLDNPPPRP